MVPPLLVGGIRPRTVALAGELTDGLIIPGGVSPDGVRASVRQFHTGRTATGAADIVVFTSVPADGPAAAAAATVSEYARAGATHIAVNAAESDADLERFVGFLAHQVAPLVEDSAGLSGPARKFVGGSDHAAKGWVSVSRWASMRCSRLLRSVRVYFQSNGRAMAL